MGLFTSKTKHRFSTTVQRLLQDDDIRDASKAIPLQAILNDLNLADAYQRHGLNGEYRNVENLYHFARKGRYTYGLLDTEVLSTTQSRDSIQAAIETEKGYPVTLSYTQFTAMNSLHFVWERLIKSYGYDFTTNELTSLSQEKGVPVYLDDVIIHHRIDPDSPPSAGSLKIFEGCDNPRSGYTPLREFDATRELSSTDSWVLGTDVVESAHIQVIWTEDTPTVIDSADVAFDAPGSITNPDGSLNLGQFTFSDTTTVEQPTVHTDTLILDLSDLDPTLDYYHARYTYSVGQSTRVGYWTYQPNAGLHPSLDTFTKTTYSTPGHFFPVIPFIRDFEALTQGAYRNSVVFENISQLMDKIGINYGELGDMLHENDLSDVRQGVTMFGVPMDTEDPMELEYLFEYYLSVLPQLDEHRNYKDSEYAIRFFDADFEMTWSFQDMETTLVSSPGTVGTFSRERIKPTALTEEMEALRAEGVRNKQGTRRSLNQFGDYTHYRIYKQITPHLKQCITISDARVMYHIAGDGDGTKADATDANMLLPLNFEVTRKLPFLKRERLYLRSLHLVMNTHVWFNAGILGSVGFQIIMLVIAIVMALPSNGASLKALAAVFASMKAFLIFVWNLVLQQVVLRWAFQQLVKWFGLETTVLLVIAMALMARHLDITSIDLVKNSWAENLLAMGNGMVSHLNIDADLEALQKEIDAFNRSSESQLEELNELQKSLTPQNLLDPFTFIDRQPMTIFGETPDSYYQRTAHSGNIGTLGFDMITNYVDIALSLPTIDQTLGSPTV